MTPTRTVLFVCLHGSAKSVIAMEYFRRLARQRGLDLEVAAAGVEPDAEIPPRVVQGLLGDGIDVRGRQPRQLTRTELAKATRVVSFGCELGGLAPEGLAVERWDDVPAVSEDFQKARDAIVARLPRLLEATAPRPLLGRTLPLRPTLTRREPALTPMSLMPRRLVALLLASGLLLGLLAGEQLASAQGMHRPSSEASAPSFDLADPAVVEEGSHLFRANCTHYCHGAEGRVSRAPALRGRQFEPGYVYQRIAKGLPPMPAFGTVLPPETIWKIVAYVLSLSNAKDD